MAMDDAVRTYVDAIAPEQRALFDRVHALIGREYPEASVVISYKMPTYRVGERSLIVGAWKHGLSFYGWDADHDGGFTARHPDLVNDKGTIRIRPEDAADIPDDELRALVRGALDA
jgi:uncharacterized protein YdhG (YjbR/CyaY superfamily)